MPDKTRRLYHIRVSQLTEKNDTREAFLAPVDLVQQSFRVAPGESFLFGRLNKKHKI